MMEKVSAQAYAELIQTCKVLEKDAYGEKVLLDEAGAIIKIFRRKRFFSSALFFTYARRFSSNAKRLQQLNVPTVTVLKLGHCSQPKRDLVWYQPITGETLRDYCQSISSELIIELLAQFVAELHRKGIMFRSLHWGNIIVTEDLTLGLIDIADIRFYRKPLTLLQRQRNFRHMLRYAIDRKIFENYVEVFWPAYAAVSHLTALQSQQLQENIALAGRS